MRVIAGCSRRIELCVAQDSKARPFLEMARGALFNSLTESVGGAAVLDLYAGSGALGIEALSRGAESAVFVEIDPASVAMLKLNLKNCHLSGKVVCAPVEVALCSMQGSFDLVFVDPPFSDSGDWQHTGKTVIDETARLLKDDGMIIFRYEHENATPPLWADLCLIRDKRYGRSRICVYGCKKVEMET